MEEFQVSCQAGKEPIDQGILYLNEQSHDQQTNMPTQQTNMPTHQDQHANTQAPAKINRKEDQNIK